LIVRAVPRAHELPKATSVAFFRFCAGAPAAEGGAVQLHCAFGLERACVPGRGTLRGADYYNFDS